MPSLLVVAALPLCVAGHGRLTTPPNRARGSLGVAGKHDDCELGSNSGGLAPKFNTCGYQNRDGYNGYKPTNCQADFMTGNLINNARSDGDCSKVKTSDSVWHMPWAAPGKAQLWSPCGVNGGHEKASTKDKHGKSYPEPRDGLDLPPNKAVQWEIGKSYDVGFALTKHHGGGYQWRLCPGVRADSHPSDSCFQSHPLNFTNADTVVHWTDGRTKSFRAKTLTGTQVTPHHSQFRMIQIPMTEQYNDGSRKPPCDGCHGQWGVDGDKIRQEWDFSLIDQVHIPNVPTGHAFLQWRWDNEQQDQVWTNCADVEIVGGGPTPPPPSPPSPSPSPPSPSPSPARLLPGEHLASGEQLVSKSGTARLKMQGDGNLVLRDGSTDESLWSSGSCCNDGAFLDFNHQGILAVRASDSSRLWDPAIHGTPVKAELQDDCNFVVRDASGTSLWSTKSSCSHRNTIVV